MSGQHRKIARDGEIVAAVQIEPWFERVNQRVVREIKPCHECERPVENPKQLFDRDGFRVPWHYCERCMVAPLFRPPLDGTEKIPRCPGCWEPHSERFIENCRQQKKEPRYCSRCRKARNEALRRRRLGQESSVLTRSGEYCRSERETSELPPPGTPAAIQAEIERRNRERAKKLDPGSEWFADAPKDEAALDQLREIKRNESDYEWARRVTSMWWRRDFAKRFGRKALAKDTPVAFSPRQSPEFTWDDGRDAAPDDDFLDDDSPE